MTIFNKLLLLLLTFSVPAFANCFLNYYEENYAKASACFIKEIKKNKNLYSPTYLSLGISLEIQGKYKEALPYVTEARNRVIDFQDYALVDIELGYIYSHLGNHELALKYFNNAISVIEDHNMNVIYLTRTYNGIGITYAYMQDSVKALENFTKAIEYYDTNESEATMYSFMAVAYEDKDDRNNTEKYYKMAIELNQQNKDNFGLCVNQSSLGNFYIKLQKYDEAGSILKEANSICHKTGNISRKANILGGLAYINFINGNNIDAKKNIRQALTLAKQSGDIRTLKNVIYYFQVINGQIKK